MNVGTLWYTQILGTLGYTQIFGTQSRYLKITQKMYHCRYPRRKYQNPGNHNTQPNQCPIQVYTRMLGNQIPLYLEAIVGPRAKFHDTRLLVEGEILHVHLA